MLTSSSNLDAQQSADILYLALRPQNRRRIRATQWRLIVPKEHLSTISAQVASTSLQRFVSKFPQTLGYEKSANGDVLFARFPSAKAAASCIYKSLKGTGGQVVASRWKDILPRRYRVLVEESVSISGGLTHFVKNHSSLIMFKDNILSCVREFERKSDRGGVSSGKESTSTSDRRTATVSKEVAKVRPSSSEVGITSHIRASDDRKTLLKKCLLILNHVIGLHGGRIKINEWRTVLPEDARATIVDFVANVGGLRCFISFGSCIELRENGGVEYLYSSEAVPLDLHGPGSVQSVPSGELSRLEFMRCRDCGGFGAGFSTD